MPIIALPPTGLDYYLLSLSANGAEVPEADGTLLSEVLLSRLSEPISAITDVFLVCHGWNTSAAAALDSYGEWMGAMAADGGGLAAASAARGGAFTPLLVGLRWPSKFLDAGGDRPPIVGVVAAAAAAARQTVAADGASADAEAGVLRRGGDGGGGTAADDAAVAATHAVLLAALEEEDAQAVADDPAAVEAFTTLATAMVTSEGAEPVLAAALAVRPDEESGRGDGGGGGTGLPEPILTALEAVPRALSRTCNDADGGGGALERRRVGADGSSGGGAQPGPSWGQANVDAANAAFRHAAKPAAPVERLGGVFARAVALVMLPLVEVVFGSYARRAAALGRVRVAAMLRDFRRAAAKRGGRAVHFHGVGHSLGAHLLLAAAVSPASTSSQRDTPRRQPALQSLSLLQGAVPATALHADGAYARAHTVVNGPTVVTRSANDLALALYRVWYGPPLGLAGCTPPPRPQLPADPELLERVMVGGGGGDVGGDAGGGVRQRYDLPVGRAVVNVNATDVVRAHGDIARDPVVHLVWEAVLTTPWLT